MARKALVICAHPYPERSRAGKALRHALGGVEGVTVHDLYDAYPHFVIDVPREQKLLGDHDLIVMQHPIFWYSLPALLKEWMDQVLTYGWAYGKGGVALHGKQLLSAVTCGGSRDSYSAEGSVRYSIQELLRPIEATARLCGLTLVDPFVVYSAGDSDTKHLAAAASDYQHLLMRLLAHHRPVPGGRDDAAQEASR